MNPLIDFYAGGTDDRNRSLFDILEWDDQMLEGTHDWVQWVFPNREPSGYNPTAPLLDDETASVLASPGCRPTVTAAFARFEAFLRLSEERPHWVTHGNHNFLRITRVLLFLREIGLDDVARAFFEQLKAVHDRHPVVIGERTLGFWTRAATGDLRASHPDRA